MFEGYKHFFGSLGNKFCKVVLQFTSRGFKISKLGPEITKIKKQVLEGQYYHHTETCQLNHGTIQSTGFYMSNTRKTA